MREDKTKLIMSIIAIIIVFVMVFVFRISNQAKNTFERMIKRGVALAQSDESFYLPNYPQRLLFTIAEIERSGNVLLNYNISLGKFLDKCSCSLATSQCEQKLIGGQQATCNTKPVLGSACQESENDENSYDESLTQTEDYIQTLDGHIARLKKLLTTEVNDPSFEKQIGTLRGDDADVLRNGLGTIITNSEDILNKTKNSLGLAMEDKTSNCHSECGKGGNFDLSGLNMCLLIKPGEQKPIEFEYTINVGVSGFKLPEKIGVNKINLNLPDKIQLPSLEDVTLPTVSISIPSITMSCPTEKKDISFKTPEFSFPESPTIKLDCPKYKAPTGFAYSTPSFDPQEYKKFNWFSQTFSWLSEKCQEAIMRNQGYKRMQEPDYRVAFTSCLDPKIVANYLVEECAFQQDYTTGGFPPLHPYLTDVCENYIWKSPAKRSRQACFDMVGLWNNNDIFGPDKDPQDTCDVPDRNAAMKLICDTFRDTPNSPLYAEEPEPCKISPIFLDPPVIPDVEDFGLFITPGPSATQTMLSYPSQPMSDCGINDFGEAGMPSFSSIPKIPLSKFSIKIPDIILPHFKIPGVIDIKLPSFIFEDLTFNDIELCNLNECQSMMPNLNFTLPEFKIPDVTIKPINLDLGDIGIPNAPEVSVSIDPIKFSPMNFKMPQFINMGSLISPEITIPSIQPPNINLDIKFGGIKVDFLGIAIDLILGLFKLPDPICFSFTFFDLGSYDRGALSLNYPDYYFSWPAFPDVPEIPICEDAKKFCRDAKGEIGQIVEKANEIKQHVDEVLNTSVQNELNTAAQSIQNAIQSRVDTELANIKQTIKDTIAFNCQGCLSEGAAGPPTSYPIPGRFPYEKPVACKDVPPFTIPLSGITIDLNDILQQKFNQLGINIPDSIDLKDKWEEWGLKEITLNLENNLSYKLPPEYQEKVDELMENLSYNKTETVRLPGFQRTGYSAGFSISSLESANSCTGSAPGGGNPYTANIGQINANISNIISDQGYVSQNVQDIKNLLR